MSEEKSPLLNGTSTSGGGEGKPGKASVKGVNVEHLPGYDGHFAAAPKRRKYYFFSNVRWYEYFVLLVGMVASAGLGATPLAFYYFFGKLVDYANDPDLPDEIRKTSYYFFGIAVVGGISAWLSNATFLYVGERVSARIRLELFEAITMQEVGWFDQTKTGTLITRLSEDSTTVRGLFSEKIGMLFTSICQCVGGLTFAFYYSWSMTLVMLGTAPLMGVAIAIQGKLTVTFTKRASDSSAHAVAVAEEVITNFRTVRSFAAEEKEVTRFEKALQSILNVGYAKAGAQGLSLGLVTACIWAAAALAFFYGAFQVEDGKITLGEVISVFGMMLFAVIGISQALNQLPEVFKTKASFAMIAEIVERTPEIPNRGGRRLDRINGQVDLSKLRFKYPTRDALVLNDLSLSVKPGQTVALVGESGSGKSTIFALVERFYDPEGGQVLIDGVDLRELDPKWYHRQVAIVSQEPILFSGSIKENIMYGKMDATDAEVVDAARAANAHDFITGLPNGYDTLVGERGIALSGGQKQRVAIARAVLKNPKILLLDEATSALDTESEALVQQALDKLMVGRTSFIIAHRLSTVRNADVIYVLSKGEVVEQGTHKGLIAKKGHYLKLATRQLARTDADDEDLDIVGSTSGAGVSSTDDDEEEKGKERIEPAL